MVAVALSVMHARHEGDGEQKEPFRLEQADEHMCCSKWVFDVFYHLIADHEIESAGSGSEHL